MHVFISQDARLQVLGESSSGDALQRWLAEAAVVGEHGSLHKLSV